MEEELDLTLRLGLPNQTVETHLSLNTPTSDQGINVNAVHGHNNDGGEIFSLRHLLLREDDVMDDDEGARNNVNVNIRVYNHIFQYFAGVGETLNFAPYPMHPSPVPTTPTVSDYVLIDVPARRAQRNNSLAIPNALDANANVRQRRGCGGCCRGRIEETKKCTNMNCNAISTPMWRRGPLGPKSLCNACGIKFRKEEERRSKRK